MHVVLTTEQIAGLAPSNYFLKTSRGFAAIEKWLSLHRDKYAAWGEFPVNQKPPIQTSLMLDRLAFNCSCASRRFPCSHGLGLLFLLAEQPNAFSQSRPPSWVTDWLDRHQKRLDERQRRETAVAPPHRRDKQLAHIQAGLAELELWLNDLVRNGLAAVRRKPAQYWTQMANRLV